MLSPGAISAGFLKRIQNQLGGSADHVVFAFARDQVIPQVDRPLLGHLGNRHALADAIVYDDLLGLFPVSYTHLDVYKRQV